MKVLIYLSDEAHSFLCQQARDLAYISPYSHAYGLGNYITALSRVTFYDTRPPDVKSLDLTLLQHNKLPLWSMELQRRLRAITTTTDAITNLRRTALSFGITNHNQPRSVDYHMSPVSALLEAVGIGWLTPRDVPYCPNPPKGNRYAKKEQKPTWI